MFTLETDLYKELNRANQWHDENMILTLGPFALLLNKVLWYPSDKANHKKNDGISEYFTVYRGLGLP